MPAALARGTMRRPDMSIANGKPLPAIPQPFSQSNQSYAPIPQAALLTQHSPHHAKAPTAPQLEEHSAYRAHASTETRQRQLTAINHTQEASRKPIYTPLPIPGDFPADRTPGHYDLPSERNESNADRTGVYYTPPQAHTKTEFPRPVYQTLARHLIDEALPPVQTVSSGKPILMTATVSRPSMHVQSHTQATPRVLSTVPPVPVGISPAALAGRAAAADARRKPAPIFTSASPLPPRSDSLPQGVGKSAPIRGPPVAGLGSSAPVPNASISSEYSAATSHTYGKYDSAQTRDSGPSGMPSKPYREKNHSGEYSPGLRGVFDKFKAAKWESKRNEAIKKATTEKEHESHPMSPAAEDDRGRRRGRGSTDQESRQRAHSSGFRKRSLSLTRLFKAKPAEENEVQPIPKWKEWRKKNIDTSAPAEAVPPKPQAHAPAERTRQNWGPFRAQEEARQSKKKAVISDPSDDGRVFAADTFAGSREQLLPKAVQLPKGKLVVNGAHTRDTTFGDFLTADTQATPTLPKKPSKSHSPSPSWAEKLMPKRRNSNSSDMSFACAGADQDQYVSQAREESSMRAIRCMVCGKPGQGEAELCNYCAGNTHLFTMPEAHAEKANRQGSVPSTFLRDSSSPLTNNRTLKLPNRSSSIYTKRATQYRPTSGYSDPGNPFDRQTRVIEGKDAYSRNLDAWHTYEAKRVTDPDLADDIPSSPEEKGKKSDTAIPGKGHWPEPPPIRWEDLEYWPRKSYWAKGAKDAKAAKPVKVEVNRNTNFYGFYDEILNNSPTDDSRTSQK